MIVENSFLWWIIIIWSGGRAIRTRSLALVEIPTNYFPTLLLVEFFFGEYLQNKNITLVLLLLPVVRWSTT